MPAHIDDRMPLADNGDTTPARFGGWAERHPSGASRSSPPLRRANVYIDGFNLYYAIRATGYKWLNLRDLCERLLPDYDLGVVRYFTAHVKPLDDPESPQRQQAYLKALSTVAGLKIHKGQFSIHDHYLPLAKDTCHFASGDRVTVSKAEEKGSDVNLGTWLLIDAYADAYDVAFVVSNDTDLVEPIRHVRRDLGKPVFVMNTVPRPAKRLVRAGSGHRFVRFSELAASQFPEEFEHDGQSIKKPQKWIDETAFADARRSHRN